MKSINNKITADSDTPGDEILPRNLHNIYYLIA